MVHLYSTKQCFVALPEWTDVIAGTGTIQNICTRWRLRFLPYILRISYLAHKVAPALSSLHFENLLSDRRAMLYVIPRTLQKQQTMSL